MSFEFASNEQPDLPILGDVQADADLSFVQLPITKDTEVIVEDSGQSRLGKVWESIRSDFKSADKGDKTLMMATVLCQAWNQSRLQQAITIPATIHFYEKNGYNEWSAGLLFAALNYAQQFGASATLGASARVFPKTLETTTEEFPSIKRAAEKIEEKTSDYATSLYSHTVTGQGLGAGPFVLAEVLADASGSTKDTVLNAEKISRRIGIGSGIICIGILKLAEQYQENEVVQEVVEYAKNPLTWIVLGGIPFIPAAFKSGYRRIFSIFKHEQPRSDKAAQA